MSFKTGSVTISVYNIDTFNYYMYSCVTNTCGICMYVNILVIGSFYKQVPALSYISSYNIFYMALQTFPVMKVIHCQV